MVVYIIKPLSKMLRIRIECGYHFNDINIKYVGDTTAIFNDS